MGGGGGGGMRELWVVNVGVTNTSLLSNQSERVKLELS